MNNNEWNNQNNYNNQPLNNNYNNGLNNLNNQVNQNIAPDKNNNIKLILMILGIVIVVLIVAFAATKLFTNSSIINGHKNTTGSTDYKGSDVDYNCVYEITKGNDKGTMYSDIIFNFKSGKYNYQIKEYRKTVYEYANGVTDSKYKEIVDSLNATECLSIGTTDKKCTGDHLDIGLTSNGWNTIVDRTSNKIVITSYNAYGLGQTASAEDKKDFIDNFIKSGYTCN